MRGKLSGNAAGWLIEEGKRLCGPARRIECLGWTEKKGGGRRRNHSSGKLCWLLFSFFLLLFSSTLPEAERKRGRRKALLMLFTEEEEGRGSLLPSSSFSSKVHCSFLSMWGWRGEGFFPPSSSQSAAWVGQSSPLLSTPKPPPKVRLWYADCGRRNKRFAEKGKVCIFAKRKGGGPLRHARRDVVKFVHFSFLRFPNRGAERVKIYDREKACYRRTLKGKRKKQSCNASGFDHCSVVGRIKRFFSLVFRQFFSWQMKGKRKRRSNGH